MHIYVQCFEKRQNIGNLQYGHFYFFHFHYAYIFIYLNTLSLFIVLITSIKYKYLIIHYIQFSFWPVYFNIESLCAAAVLNFAKRTVTSQGKTRILLPLSQNDVCKAHTIKLIVCLRILCIRIKAAQMLNNLHYYIFVIYPMVTL